MMKGKHKKARVCLTVVLLMGLLAGCGFELSGEDTLPTDPDLHSDDTLQDGAKSESAASDPALPRTFSLPQPLFAANDAWNQSASGAQVLPDSDQQILVTYQVLLGDDTDLHPQGLMPEPWPFMWVNFDEYTMPVYRAGAGQQSVLLCDYDGNLQWPGPKFPDPPQLGGPVTVPAAGGTVRPAAPEGPDSDGHLVLYDPDTFTAYDFWQATTVQTGGDCTSSGGGLDGPAILEAGAIEFFDVRGPGANLDGYSSARAMGTPLLAGLILPEDVESGTISHALALALPGPRNLSSDPYEPLPSDYAYPASTTETDFYSTNPYALAAGQRLRLKQALVDDAGNALDENQLAAITHMFLTALRTHGAYLVDNAGGLTFYAEDISTAVLDLTDDQVNALIGEPSGTPLAAGKTKWQIVMEKLNEELEQIPFAYGPWTDGQDPRTAMIDVANFEVVGPATRVLTETNHLPLALKSFSSAPAAGEPMALEEVGYWAYQIQDLDGPGAVDTLVASHYDMLVLEPTRTDWTGSRDFDTRGMVTQLKNSLASDGVHRKGVIAYIDIGEAEDWRWYWTWSTEWDCVGDPPADWPDYILTCDPDGWSGNYPVAYWDEDWKDIIIFGNNPGSDPDRDYVSVIDEVIIDGFDGIYLDWVEAFEDSTVMAAAQAAGLDPAVEMIAFIQEMRDYARSRNPDFVIIQQNAASLIDGHPELLNVIDAISQEAIWYDGEADVDWGDPDGYDWENEASLVTYYNGYLGQYLGAGVPVFDCEYALNYANTAYVNSTAAGYVPYVSQRALSRLTTTPPPGY